MYVSATDPEELGHQQMYWLFCYAEIRCFVSVFASFLILHLFGTPGILKGPLQPKKLFSQYMEF